jgi:hypothetical protein
MGACAATHSGRGSGCMHGEPCMCVTTKRGSQLRSLLATIAGYALATRAQGRRPPCRDCSLLSSPRPATACRPTLFSLCVVRAQAKLPLLHAACSIAALADRINQLQGWPGRLPIHERSAGPHLHASVSAFVTVDCLQLSVGLNFFCHSMASSSEGFHVFEINVSSSVACVSSGCCICCIGYTHTPSVLVSQAHENFSLRPRNINSA